MKNNNTKKHINKNNFEIPDFSKPKKQKPNYFLFFFKVFIFVVIIACALSYLFTNETFKIIDHDINGINYAAPSNMDKIAQSYHGKNFFLLNKASIAHEYMQIREIKSVQIKRKFPNKIIINIKEKEPVCCFKTPSGKFLITNSGLCYHKISGTETVSNIPTVLCPYNKISIGMNIIKDLKKSESKKKHKKKTFKSNPDDKATKENFKIEFLFELAKTCYNNKLNINSIQIKNDFEVILWTNNNTLIKFGATADILDKCYLLKQIYIEKKDLLGQMKEIYIINSKTATYKLKNNG